MGVGVAIVQIMQSAASGSLMPGNGLLYVADLARPALLIWFLLSLRHAERVDAPTIVLRGWMIPVRQGSVYAVGISATAFALGSSTGQIVALSLAGIAIAAAAFWWIVSRATSHRAPADR
jgi:hypothetical protein